MSITETGIPLETPANSTARLAVHMEGASSRIHAGLMSHGAVLFRGFSYDPDHDSERILAALGTHAIPYTERSSPRTEVGHLLYTATDYPARLPISLHNENAYQQSWPRWLIFTCVEPPGEGGETVLADVQQVMRTLDRSILEEFRRRDWSLVRNYGRGIGLDWSTAFQTSDPDRVNEYCRLQGIAFEWPEPGVLRTAARRRAVVPHVDTGVEAWFNHIMFFHISAVDEATRSAMLELFGEDHLPANTYYGDGDRIPDEVIAHIRQAYDACSISHRWTAGDVLILDNMRLAHGRKPYRGDRRLFVMLAGAASRPGSAARSPDL